MQSTIYAYPLPNLGSSENVNDLRSSASSGPPSSSPHYYRSATVHKRRRIDRACDTCRRRKTKCDGPKMPDNVCTNCLQTKKSCTYMWATAVYIQRSAADTSLTARPRNREDHPKRESSAVKQALSPNETCQLYKWTRRQNGEVGSIAERGRHISQIGWWTPQSPSSCPIKPLS
jgi:hypothetical protein